MILVHRCEAFDNMQGVAVKIAGSVEPAQVVEIGRVDNKGFTLPVAIGPSHPAVGRRVIMIHVNRSHGAGILKRHHDVLRAHHDLKGVRHIHGARHARQIAFDFRIPVQPIGEKFPSFSEAPRACKE